jgi:hypothetical protein
LAADGSFEIVAAPDEQPGNWMKLDPSAHKVCLLVRDIWDDWQVEEGATIHIEALDALPSDSLTLTESEITERLGGIAYQTSFSLKTWVRMVDEVYDAVGFNHFWLPTEDTTRIGGNPRAGYVKMLYDLTPEQAIVIECEIPSVKHWSLQLADSSFKPPTTGFISPRSTTGRPSSIRTARYASYCPHMTRACRTGWIHQVCCADSPSGAGI